MNRAERRRLERAGRPIALLTDTGVYDSADSLGKLPAKAIGQHRWVVTTAYTMTEDQLLAATAEIDTFFDHENRIMIGVGCWDCKQAYPEIAPGSWCPSKGDG